MPPRPGAIRSRWTAYAGVSAVLAAGVVLKAVAQRPNFYSAAVYLWQSSANLMILCNIVFVIACSLLIFLQKLLYGPLRTIEIEQLYEKAWFAVTETCLAMTIFRGEIGAWFLVMFFSLLAGKVWGWIGEGRVEVLEQQQHNVLAGRNARLFHTRLAVSLALSVIFDMTMLEYVVGQVLHMARPDMMVMFGFEFAILTTTSLSTATRYALNLIEIGIVRGQKQKRMDAIRKERIDAAVRGVVEHDQQESNTEGGQPATSSLEQRRLQAAAAAASVPIDEADVEVEGWEGKGRWIFYLDLTTDFFKLVIYLSFFFILLIFYGLPLHIMRDVFLTCRSFIKRIGDFMRYRTATRDMNERYPDATEAEIGDNECIICREEMRVYVPPAAGAATDPLAERMRPKKLPCGHVLHFSCLRSWLERQQICPTCRATVVPTPRAAQGAVPLPPGVPPRVQHPQNAGNGRPRVFQIGPLRIGVGAARGNNMFEELQEQLVNINPPPVPVPPGNGPQQYGIGIRWDGIRRRGQAGHRHPRGSIQDSLDVAERQIQRELDSLQASMGELQALRNIQAQLARIRLAGQGPIPPVPQVGVQQNALPIPRPTTGSTVTSLAAQPQQAVLQAGNPNLPEGLTLPEGWTMMPLQPVQPQPFPPSLSGMFGPGVMQNNIPNIPNMPHMPHVPHMPVATPPVPQPQPQSQQQSPSLLNILREAQDVVRETDGSSELPRNQSTEQDQHSNPLAESIRLQNEVTQSRERLADLTGQLRTMVQNMPGSTNERLASNQNSQQIPNTSTRVQSQPRQSQSNLLPTPSVSQPRPSQHSTPSQSGEQRNASIPPTSQQRPSQPIPQPPVRDDRSAQRSSGMSRPTATATAPAAALNARSIPNTNATVDAPQKLLPTSPVKNGTSDSTRTRSPHRPTRSIGSSWGFSGVDTKKNDDNEVDEDDDSDEVDEHEDKSKGKGNENDDHEDTDDSEDDDEDDDIAEAVRKAYHSTRLSGGPVTGTKTPSTSQSRVLKDKKPTVEDLSDDPD